jgi:hypothetical protein
MHYIFIQLPHVTLEITSDDPDNKPFGPTQNETTMSRYLGYGLSLFMMAIHIVKLEDKRRMPPIQVVLTDRQKAAACAIAHKMDTSPTTYRPTCNNIIHEMLMAFFFDIHDDFDKLARVEPIGVWIMLASIDAKKNGKFRDAAPIVSILGGLQWVMRLAAVYEVDRHMTSDPREDNAVSYVFSPTLLITLYGFTLDIQACTRTS